MQSRLKREWLSSRARKYLLKSTDHGCLNGTTLGLYSVKAHHYSLVDVSGITFSPCSGAGGREASQAEGGPRIWAKWGRFVIFPVLLPASIWRHCSQVLVITSIRGPHFSRCFFLASGYFWIPKYCKKNTKMTNRPCFIVKVQTRNNRLLRRVLRSSHLRHPWQLTGNRCDRALTGVYCDTTAIHEEPRKSAATRVAPQGVPAHVRN